MEAKELGEYIAQKRKEKQITQKELAKRLNVTDKAVSRWERGLGFPDINTLELLANALEITLTELMRCSNETEDTLDKGIIASIEIAKVQRKKAFQKIIIGGIGCLMGISTILYAIRLFVTHLWSLGFRGNDGATSIFVVGRVGRLPATIILIIGIIVLLCGSFIMLRSKNQDKKNRFKELFSKIN